MKNHLPFLAMLIVACATPFAIASRLDLDGSVLQVRAADGSGAADIDLHTDAELEFNSDTFMGRDGAAGEVYVGATTDTADGTLVSQTVRQENDNGGTWVKGVLSEEITLNTGGLTTDSTANLLPANSIIEAVTYRVTTTITTTTDFTFGDATQGSRFLTTAETTLTAGTTGVCLDHTDPSVGSEDLGPTQKSAAKLRITCTGANPGAGAVRVTVYYRQFTASTS